jgi:hypothetical protein
MISGGYPRCTLGSESTPSHAPARRITSVSDSPASRSIAPSLKCQLDHGVLQIGNAAGTGTRKIETRKLHRFLD